MRLRLKGIVRCAVAAVLVTATADSLRAGVTVDGNLSEWGVTNASLSSWTIAGSISGSTTGTGFAFSYLREDVSDVVDDSGPLGPNLGGQRYDAEFMGVGVDGSNLVIAIVTGQRRDNGLQRFSPGDIRITTNAGVYGIEAGGGQGGTAGTSVVENGTGSGSTYTLNGNGFTTAHTASTAGAVGVEHRAGSMWKTTAADWILDPITGGTPPKNGFEPVQVQFNGGTYAGTADYMYLFDGTLGSHAVIELSISLSYFGNATITGIQWAPACGNDFVYVEGQAIATPEPATLVMGLFGIAGVVGMRRFRRSDA
jgi:hypothetical protein